METIHKLREVYWSSDIKVHARVYALLFQMCSTLCLGGILAIGGGVYGYGWWLLPLGVLLLVGGVFAFRRLRGAEQTWLACNG